MLQKQTAVCAVLLTLVGVGITGNALAQEKHESNTLKKTGQKIGHATSKAAKATEYGARKAGEGVSVTTHRAIGRNSVQRDRGKKQSEVVKPDGTHVPVPANYNKPVKRDLNGKPKG